MNKFQAWVNHRKPKVTPDVKAEVEGYHSTPEEDLAEAWAEFKEAWKWPIRLFKTSLLLIFSVCFLWSLAVVDIQNDCYKDKECREWITEK